MSTTDRTTPNHVTTALATETKASTKTTEFFAYVAAVVAVVITAFVVGDNGSSDGGEGDPFGAEHAMRFITFLTIGYMIARGLAKSGSRQHHAVGDHS